MEKHTAVTNILKFFGKKKGGCKIKKYILPVLGKKLLLLEAWPSYGPAYLGQVITMNRGIMQEINNRVKLAYRAFKRNNTIFF